MAILKPLIFNNGIRQIQAGDTLDPAFVPGLNLNIKSALLDFGADPTRDKDFTITDEDIAATNLIECRQVIDIEHGKSVDEYYMDSFIFKAIPGNGFFDLHAVPITGSVSGIFKIIYVIL
jgi:hypothetical protein